jgi:hypothetical protein
MNNTIYGIALKFSEVVLDNSSIYFGTGGMAMRRIVDY